MGVFRRYLGGQRTLPVAEPIAFQEERPGLIVRLQDPSATIQLDDPRPSVLE